MEILTIPTEELSDERRADIIGICIAAHDKQDFVNLFTYIPSGGRHFLAYDGSDLVSHAVVTTRWAQPDGHRELRTAFVDAVSTLPSYQGRGYGLAAMRELGSRIDDYEIGCLQTDNAAGFYTKLGWELWRGPLFGREDDQLIPTPEQQGVMILRPRETPVLDLDSALSIERQGNRFWE